MNKYVFTTTSHAGNSVSTSCIVAQDEFDALAKAYKHYGGCQLTNKEEEAMDFISFNDSFRDLDSPVILYKAEKE